MPLERSSYFVDDAEIKNLIGDDYGEGVVNARWILPRDRESAEYYLFVKYRQGHSRVYDGDKKFLCDRNNLDDCLLYLEQRKAGWCE